MTAVFRWGNLVRNGSLVMGVQNNKKNGLQSSSSNINFIDGPVGLDRFSDSLSSSESCTDNFPEQCGLITHWLEIWDYVGGARFRGFIAEKEGERSLFVFFDQDVLGSDLKPGLMALLELCNVSDFDCTRLVVCLDRILRSTDVKGLMRDLGWVGFEPLTLADWTDSENIVSDRWIYLGIDA